MSETELQVARETNKRLNRRLQELESVIARNKLYTLGLGEGYDRGAKATGEFMAKRHEKELADYKRATRLEMARLREQRKGGES